MTRERLPPLPPERWTAAQEAAAQRVAAGPRGRLLGPFAVLLRSTELMDRVQEVGAHLRYRSRLPARLFELVVLVVARRWDQDVEWAHHRPIALAAGLPPEVVDAVARDVHSPPGSGDAAVHAVWNLADQLLRTGTVDEPAYAAALAALGEEALVEAVTAVGYYTTLALVMNVAGTPPEGERLPARGTGSSG